MLLNISTNESDSRELKSCTHGQDMKREAYQGDDDEHGGGDGSHNVGPHTRAVHEALEPAQVLLEEGAVVIIQHNLEVTLHTHIAHVQYLMHVVKIVYFILVMLSWA